MNETTQVLKLFAEEATQKTGESKNEIAELFKNVFPNGWMMLATILAVLIFFGVLTFFVYKPLKKTIKERKDFIQSNIDSSIESKEKALKLEEKRNEELWEARISAAQIVNQAKMESEKIVIEYTTNAKKEAKRIMEDAHITISQLQKKFEQDSKEEIISVATKLASKVLEKHISSYDEHKMIEQLLNEQEH